MPFKHLKPFTVFDLYAIRRRHYFILKLLQRLSIIPRSKNCEKCGSDMSIGTLSSRSFPLVWRCSHRSCRYRASVLVGTFFEESRLLPGDILCLIYDWCCGVTQHTAAAKFGLGRSTVQRWYARLQDIASRALLGGEFQLGGENRIVEVILCKL